MIDNFLKNKGVDLQGFVTNTATEFKSTVKKNAGKFLNYTNVAKDKLKNGNLKDIHDGMGVFKKNKATKKELLKKILLTGLKEKKKIIQ